MSSHYIELHTASAFSFLQGASLPEALVDRAAALGYPALALLDRDGVYGAPRFHKAARVAGVRPIIGAELTIGAGGAGEAGKAGEEKAKVRTCLAVLSLLFFCVLLCALCASVFSPCLTSCSSWP